MRPGDITRVTGVPELTWCYNRNTVMRTKVVLEFRNKHRIVGEPGCMLTGGEGGFKPIAQFCGDMMACR